MAAWIRALLEKKPFKLVSIALANKLARIALVLLTRKENLQTPPARRLRGQQEQKRRTELVTAVDDE